MNSSWQIMVTNFKNIFAWGMEEISLMTSYCSLLCTKQALPGRHLGAHEAVGRAHGAVPGREHDEGETAIAATIAAAQRAVLHHCNIQPRPRVRVTISKKQCKEINPNLGREGPRRATGICGQRGRACVRRPFEMLCLPDNSRWKT